MGVQLKLNDLRKAIDSIMQPIDLNLVDPTTKNSKNINKVEYHKIVLFQECSVTSSGRDKHEIVLFPTEVGAELFFNTINSGYFTFLLNQVIKLKSRSAYAMFLLLQQSRRMTSQRKISFDVDALLDYFGYHSPFAYFRRDVIDKNCRELTKIGYAVTYKVVKSGRYADRVVFVVDDHADKLRRDLLKVIGDIPDDDMVVILSGLRNDTCYLFTASECRQILDTVIEHNPTTDITPKYFHDCAVRAYKQFRRKHISAEDHSVDVYIDLLDKQLENSNN